MAAADGGGTPQCKGIRAHKLVELAVGDENFILCRALAVLHVGAEGVSRVHILDLPDVTNADCSKARQGSRAGEQGAVKSLPIIGHSYFGAGLGSSARRGQPPRHRLSAHPQTRRLADQSAGRPVGSRGPARQECRRVHACVMVLTIWVGEKQRQCTARPPMRGRRTAAAPVPAATCFAHLEIAEAVHTQPVYTTFHATAGNQNIIVVREETEAVHARPVDGARAP